jgi:hypothetical protein
MRSSAFTIALAGALFACSGGHGGDGSQLLGACPTMTNCGGNIVGTWSVSNFCGPGANSTKAGVLMNCPSSSATANAGATGTLTFNADSTYTVTLTSTGGGTDVFPKSCLNGSTCAEVQQTIQQSPTAAQFSSLTCPDDGTNCNCTFVLAPQTNTDTGTYSVSGGTLTTTPSAGTGMPGATQYCVNGNEVSFASTSTTSPTIIIVAVKK